MNINKGPTHCDKLCRNCLSSCSTDKELESHQKLCWEHEPCIGTFQTKNSSKSLDNYIKKL